MTAVALICMGSLTLIVIAAMTFAHLDAKREAARDPRIEKRRVLERRRSNLLAYCGAPDVLRSTDPHVRKTCENNDAAIRAIDEQLLALADDKP